MQEVPVHEVPALSVPDRGSRMTQLAPGQPVGRAGGMFVARILVCVAASSVPFMGLLGIVPTAPALQWLASPWGLVVVLVFAAFAFVQTSSLRAHARYAFGQPRVASLMGSLTVTGGFAVGAAVWTLLALSAEPSPPLDLRNIATASDLPRELAVLIGGVFGAWSLFTLLRLPGAVRHARSRQATLARLRDAGRRHAGVLTDVTFRNHWVWDEPFFTIRVTYDLDGGSDGGCGAHAHPRRQGPRRRVADDRVVRRTRRSQPRPRSRRPHGVRGRSSVPRTRRVGASAKPFTCPLGGQPDGAGWSANLSARDADARCQLKSPPGAMSAKRE